MDVVFGDTLLRPRRLILEAMAKEGIERASYTTCSESNGVGYHPECALRTLEEWLIWLDRFSDDLTGRQIREAKEAAKAPFTEPASWAGFRERYAATGDPWIP